MMTIDLASDIVGHGIKMVLVVSLIAIVPSLLVGLCVSIFQATTQINEQTLSFLPRLAITLTTLTLAGKWMITRLTDFTIEIFNQAAQLVG